MRSPRLRLILLSFLMLFVELALIRWLGSKVVYLSYFSNFVLLGSFLGIGVGFLRAKRRRNLWPWAPLPLAILVVFVAWNPVEIDKSVTELLYYQSPGATGLPIWIMLPVIFGAVAVVMAFIAEGVARTFKRFEALTAYRLDIIGSILGIIGFSVLSFLDAPPIGWAMVVAALFLILYLPRLTLVQAVSILVVIGFLGVQSIRRDERWSPYYRVTFVGDPTGAVRVNVNGSPHQILQTNADRRELGPLYFVPYDWRTSEEPPRNVLIIGAGTGQDTATALVEGAGHVDAVEIDPILVDIGRTIHPERPFLDERVTTVVNDGRAYLQGTDEKYDMILFALPDSLTLVSGQAGVRLESYLFTKEAIEKAKEHLTPDGTLFVVDYFRETWVADRVAGTLQEAFGRSPCKTLIGESGHEVLFGVSPDPAALSCDTTWSFAGGAPPAPATDDHPFPYLRTNALPGFYYLAIALLLAASIATVWLVSRRSFRRISRYTDLFFMGAAFLLLETKSVVQFALLFGTTWLVNSLVFLAIMLTVLAAIEVARRVKLRQPGAIYGLLFVSLVVAYIVPVNALLEFPPVVRFVLGSLLAFVPIFLANLVFARRFRDVGSSTIAFGANLLGAMVGGLLEYVSIIVGYRNLLIVVAILYVAAWFFGRKHIVGRGNAGADTDGAAPTAGVGAGSDPVSGAEAPAT